MSNGSQNGDTSLTPIAIFVIGVVFVGATISIAVNRGLGVFQEPTGYVMGGLSLLSLVGIIYVGLGMKAKTSKEGFDEALDWFFNHEIGGSSSSNTSNSGSTTDKVPPPTEKKKLRLKFERAGRECEFCESPSDHLEIHHITPRAEGGSNRLRNLIALCPECHRKADSGAYSKSELKYQVRKRMNNWDDQ